MPRGPLPNPDRRRRNAPTVPTTKLPVAGRKGSIPRPPKTVPLGARGVAWWRWAWRTPQAAAWDTGALHTVARRARLEDDLAAIETVGFDPPPVMPDDLELTAYLETIQSVVRQLKALAGGSLAVAREMRELDDRLGLTPKARAQLRWAVVDEPVEVVDEAGDEVARLRAERQARLAAAP